MSTPHRLWHNSCAGHCGWVGWSFWGLLAGHRHRRHRQQPQRQYPCTAIVAVDAVEHRGVRLHGFKCVVHRGVCLAAIKMGLTPAWRWHAAPPSCIGRGGHGGWRIDIHVLARAGV